MLLLLQLGVRCYSRGSGATARVQVLQPRVRCRVAGMLAHLSQLGGGV